MKLIPLAAGSKSPLEGQSWKELVSENPRDHERWKEQGLNFGLPLLENSRSVLDFDGIDHQDGREFAREFYKRHRELCTFIVETAAGNIHFHFDGNTKTRKIFDSGTEIGDIKGNGYVLWEGSRVRDGVYRILRSGPLLPFPEHLFPIPQKENKLQTSIDENDPIRRLIRAREWMKKREGKEDGNGRGLQMIKTCRALFRMFGLTEDQVWPLILEFNERNVPPYTEKQLRHKIEDAQK